jgi:hypothetical protein
LQQFPRFAEQVFTRGCQLERMSLTLQQRLPELIFEGFDLPAQGGLCQKYFLRGPTDVAGLGNGYEVTQLAQFHPRQHNLQAVSGQELGIGCGAMDGACCQHENN